MAITQTQLETELEQVKTYIAAGNYQAARVALANAEITMSGLPDYGIGGRYVRFRDSISSLKKTLSQLETDSSAARKNKRVFGKYYRG